MTPGMHNTSVDKATADAFTASWNNLPVGSVYSAAQFAEWFEPLTQEDVAGKTVLELGCGGGNLMTHLLSWKPQHLTGVDLGESIEAARKNCHSFPSHQWSVVQHDLVSYRGVFDVVYCIGVLHHLKDPEAGVRSLIENVQPGGRFHGWVYAHEGNAIIRWFVDPLRRIASRLPWWLIKYGLATPLVAPFYVYAKCLALLSFPAALSFLPMYQYASWIAARPFSFFRHVAFDQLVTPQTAYMTKTRVEEWLRNPLVEEGSTYLIFRNGNSWKFGGKRKLT
jgi:SAM-dependent methyltransferase